MTNSESFFGAGVEVVDFDDRGIYDVKVSGDETADGDDRDVEELFLGVI